VSPPGPDFRGLDPREGTPILRLLGGSAPGEKSSLRARDALIRGPGARPAGV